jgi:toxin ParE1/3/4
MSSYSFSDTAIQYLDKICEYITIENIRAASQLFDKIRQKCKLVVGFPNMRKTYPKLNPNLRGFVVEDYIVFYYPNSDGINIARVISGYRDLDDMF